MHVPSVTAKPTAHPNTPIRVPSNLTSKIIKAELSLGNGIGSLKHKSLQVPLFVLADWATRFLPTLYHTLFCAEKPFHDFSKGTGLIDIIQQVLDAVHPNHNYVVTADSKLYHNVPTPRHSFTFLANQTLLL